jgi:branched-chain amino acid aminotransferase
METEAQLLYAPILPFNGWKADFSLPMNRGYRYGDGFFETMLLKEGRLPLLPYHLERMQIAMDALKLMIDLERCRSQIETAVEVLAGKIGTIRLFCHRQGGVGYKFTSNEAFIFLEFEGLENQHLGPCSAKTIEMQSADYYAFGFKSLSMLPYVLDGNNGQEGIEILMADGMLVEGLNHSVAVGLAGKIVFPIAAKGIFSVGKTAVVDRLLKEKQPYYQQKISAKELKEAEWVLFVNAKGMQVVATIDGVELGMPPKEFLAMIASVWA